MEMKLFESRKRLLNNLIPLITSETVGKNALCISIDAGWGYGKTFFLDKLSSTLNENSQIVIEYNAWENDISDDAFISFTDTLISGLRPYIEKTDFINKANDILEAFGKATLKTVTDRIALFEIISGLVKDTKEELDIINDEKSAYFSSRIEKTKLSIVKDKVNESLCYFFSNCKKEYKDKKVFILVDELDRCRPDFAVQVLERLKHLFSNPKLCFVFAINNKQLQQSVCHSFGDIGYSMYLEKFFDFSFVLPEPDTNDFLNSCVSFSGNEKQKPYYVLLCRMICDAGNRLSLRIIEKIISHFNTICRIVDDFDKAFRTPYLIPIAVFSKIADCDFFYDVLKSGNSTHYYDHKYDRFRTVYNRFRYIDSKINNNGIELLGSFLQEDDYHLFPASYASGNERYYNLGASEYIRIASKTDLIKVFDIVASLA